MKKKNPRTFGMFQPTGETHKKKHKHEKDSSRHKTIKNFLKKSKTTPTMKILLLIFIHHIEHTLRDTLKNSFFLAPHKEKPQRQKWKHLKIPYNLACLIKHKITTNEHFLKYNNTDYQREVRYTII